ncbi:MAG: hypothetical protein A2086_07490 [Spirochaetes bacterium GWD1_27_9]|nr:MAG: hypothetical protein A2Z98_18135 [Spirochaetes bacterium GWB1_27_13]OHD27950.1 MAG: hypothetical protein A2Y34_13325 [Spirochaetes bacterium GWC1_27_15]OHD44776.1 MAG: hypothetical protein A2086_07490 [Spirochaetes bacterium GWD1_27_9]
MKDKYYNIGTISKLCNISIRTLRYYDEIGILKPDFIDSNDYRYYSPDKIIDINYIQILKNLNFSLKEISNLIHNDIDFQIISDLYQNKLNFLNKQIESLENIKQSLNNQISKIKLINIDNIEKEKISIKNIPDEFVATQRFSGQVDFNIFALNLRKFKAMLLENQIKPNGYYKNIIYNYLNNNFSNSDMDIYVQVDKNLFGKFPFIEKKEAYSCVSFLHYGQYETLQKSYNFLLNWVKEKDYKIIDNIINTFIICYDITLNSKKFVTEIQIPINFS